MEQEQTSQESPRFLYNNMNELISEWQNSGRECSFWEYLNISETAFKFWVQKCKSGIFEN